MARNRAKRRWMQTGGGEIQIESLSHDGRGIGHLEDGKTVFVDFALPGERVRFRPLWKRRGVFMGTTEEVIDASDERIDPKCELFGECGGCVLQHLHTSHQIAYKQQQLLSNLDKIGKVSSQHVLEPILADDWGYRRRARLGIKYVPKKGGLILGFRERNSSYIQPMQTCPVLDPRISDCLPAFRQTLENTTIKQSIPQVEVAAGDSKMAFVLRHLEAFTQNDLNHLCSFAESHHVLLYLQPGKLDSVYALYPEKPKVLSYALDQFELEIEFRPTDFVQVNAAINQKMVASAVELLAPQADERVLDLFCGVGNFSLPLARHAKQLVGVEGEDGLVNQARYNADHNQVPNAEFFSANLYNEDRDWMQHDWAQRQYDKVLLDPPRSGAAEVLPWIAKIGVSRVVYVSCDPATLARDAGTLVNQHGFTLDKAGVINMFPHTAHIESIAVFTRTL